MLRGVLTAALAFHGVIHLIGVVVAWEFNEFDDFAYSTEVIGGIDIGTIGMRVLGVLWLAATVSFVAAALGLARGAGWALRGIVVAAVLSTGACVLQVESAWRGLIIDLVVLAGVAGWWYATTHDVSRREVSR